MAPLLRQEPRRIGRPPGPPASDRVPESLATGTPQTLRDGLAAVIDAADIPGRVSDLVRYASDASPYRLVPQVVVTPRTPVEDADAEQSARISARSPMSPDASAGSAAWKRHSDAD